MWDYMSKVQNDLSFTMRTTLIDWLVEVAQEYNLRRQTLYLTVNYVDRYLSCKTISRSRLQLVGITCMWLAAKYEELDPPTADEFVYIADNTYTRDEVCAICNIPLLACIRYVSYNIISCTLHMTSL